MSSRLNLFDADIYGHDFEHGKPHPMIFLTAPQEPGFPPEHCFVVEYASSGVQAARASGRGDSQRQVSNYGEADR